MIMTLTSVSEPTTADYAKVARDGLGRGFSTLTYLPQALLMAPEKFEVETAPSGIPFSLNLVDSRSSFAQEIAFNARAKFGYAAGEASGRMSMSSSYHKSQRSLSVVMTKTVGLVTQFLREPVARKEAVSLARDRMAFLSTYGDQIVTKVTIGGAMTLIYQLQFQDVETASAFSASFEVSYGKASGAADFSQKILHSGIDMAINVQGIVSGVKKAPSIVFETVGVDQVSAKVDGKSAQVDALLKYFSDFETHVQTDGVAVSISLLAEPVKNCVNLPRDVDYSFDKQNEELDRATKLDDEIDDRLSRVDYIEAVARRWNENAEQTTIDRLRSELKKAADELNLAAKHVGQLKADSLQFDERTVPSLPIGWRVRKLKPAAGFPFNSGKVMNGTMNYLNDRLQLPDLEEGSPVIVTYRHHWEAADSYDHGACNATIIISTQVNGVRTTIFGPYNYQNGNPENIGPVQVFVRYAKGMHLVIDAKAIEGKFGFTIGVDC